MAFLLQDLLDPGMFSTTSYDNLMLSKRARSCFAVGRKRIAESNCSSVLPSDSRFNRQGRDLLPPVHVLSEVGMFTVCFWSLRNEKGVHSGVPREENVDRRILQL